MSNVVEVVVPDIGNFDSVDVIEVLVKAGDVIALEDSLITVESDKASMDIPSSVAGTVTEVKVKVGDKVAKGSLMLLVEANAATATSANVPVQAEATQSAPAQAVSVQAPLAASQPVATSAAASASQAVPPSDLHAEVVVLGSGPGGYTAAFRAADLGKKVVLIERYSTLGGVCLNVGCIPSKALLHTAKVITEAGEMAHSGITFGKPKIEIDKLRAWKDGVIGKLTQGLAALVKQRKVTVVQGKGEFASPNMIRVDTKEGV